MKEIEPDVPIPLPYPEAKDLRWYDVEDKSFNRFDRCCLQWKFKNC